MRYQFSEEPFWELNKKKNGKTLIQGHNAQFKPVIQQF